MINNISNNTISGSIKEINQEYSGFDLTAPQFYSCLLCLTLVIIVAIITTTRLIQTIILRVNFITPKIKEEIKKQIVAELEK